MVRDYGPSNQYTWTPASGEDGVYALQVWVRNSGSTAHYDAWLGTGFYNVAPAKPLVVTSLTATTTMPAVGMGITWTASTEGGSGPFTFAFYRYSGVSWQLVRDWGPEPTYSWTPAAGDAGTSAVQVFARNTGSIAAFDAWLGTGYFEVGAARPLTVNVAVSHASPAVGMATTWTAVPDGGTGPLSYQFWKSAGVGPWTVARDWHSSPTFEWLPIPGEQGAHALQVFVRNAGSNGRV